MIRQLAVLFAPIVLLAWASTGHALDLATEDFGVVFPSGWQCEPDNNLFICTENDAPRQKAAIILINFKNAGPTETLADFRNRLQKPKTSQVENKAPRLSRVISFQDRVINGVTWVEALHFEGELPDYYTYYLATRKSEKFFLVTMSANKNSWSKYRKVFEEIVSSLRILTPEPTTSKMATSPQGQVPGPKAQIEAPAATKAKSPFTRGRLFLMGAVILFCLIVLYAVRK